MTDNQEKVPADHAGSAALGQRSRARHVTHLRRSHCDGSTGSTASGRRCPDDCAPNRSTTRRRPGVVLQVHTNGRVTRCRTPGRLSLQTPVWRTPRLGRFTFRTLNLDLGRLCEAAAPAAWRTPTPPGVPSGFSVGGGAPAGGRVRLVDAHQPLCLPIGINRSRHGTAGAWSRLLLSKILDPAAGRLVGHGSPAGEKTVTQGRAIEKLPAAPPVAAGSTPAALPRMAHTGSRGSRRSSECRARARRRPREPLSDAHAAPGSPCLNCRVPLDQAPVGRRLLRCGPCRANRASARALERRRQEHAPRAALATPEPPSWRARLLGLIQLRSTAR